MAFIDILKNGYTGKLGETVGQKWKNQLTVRTHNQHNTSKSEKQIEQRLFYKAVLDYASDWYSSSRNLILPPGTKMNKFNFLTSFISKIYAGTIPMGSPAPFMGLKNTNIVYPVIINSGGKSYIYINDPLGRIQKKISSVSLHILFSIDDRTSKAVPIEGLEFVSIYDKSLSGTIGNIPVKKGFAVEISPPSIPNTMVVAYLTVKVGKQRVFSQTSMISKSINIPDGSWEDN